MPLAEATERREIHHRTIDMKAYARDDGLFDVEARLVDRKPFAFTRPSTPEPVPAGHSLHDLSIRLTLDDDFVVRAVLVSADVTPYGLCKETQATLSVLVGERVARGWSSRVKTLLRGAASCTHLMELLIPIGTTAMQGIGALRPERREALDGDGVPVKIDTCYAYGRQRELVQRLWPQHYRPKDGR